MIFGPINFAAPFALLALIGLPLLLWAIRATPPLPKRVSFPPARLLLGLSTDEQTRERAPLWLLLLRMVILALVIVAFARPSLAPQAIASGTSARTLIVLDNGWTSAPFWREARNAALNAIADAERAGAPIHLLLTAPEAQPRDVREVLTPASARTRINRLEPSPWRPNLSAAATRLDAGQDRFGRIIWISDGLDDGGAEAFARTLAAHGPVIARTPNHTALALVSITLTRTGIDAIVRRAPNGPPRAVVAAETLDARALGAGEARFAPGASNATAHIELPPEIAARATRVRLVGEASAGGVRLFANGAARPFVGLVDAGGSVQPLVSDLYYPERALSPYANLRRGLVDELISARVQAIVLSDSSALSAHDRAALGEWVERGGELVRFAGPRLADQPDDLTPVRLRAGARTLGGALAWEKPPALAPFSSESPFAGLGLEAGVTVRRQVLDQSAQLENAQVWAALDDNSPLVSAQTRGRGLIVLFHVTAGPAWSDLPLAGLFVDMLRRTLSFAGRAESGATPEAATSGPYTPTHALNGFGELEDPASDAPSIPFEKFSLAAPGPDAPPGLYERAGVAAALDAARGDEDMRALDLPDGVQRAKLDDSVARPIAGWLFALASLLFSADMIIALHLFGRLPRLPRWAPKAALIAVAIVVTSPHAHAQINPYTLRPLQPQAERDRQSDPTLALRLAYVRTGDAAVDRISAAGLEALSDQLSIRTEVEPGAAVGIDLARDDLSPYPFLYWPATSNAQPLRETAIANLERFMATGGLLLVDTRGLGAVSGARPAATMLRGLPAPPLERVARENVLSRAFYILNRFPGRASDPEVWAETAESAQSRDGVASIIIGDGDWASAWAGVGNVPGGPRQREMALRFGINVVMVALTGNYKSDQVHVPALLERLGRDPR